MGAVSASKFRKWCNQARNLWPLDKTVYVRRVPMKGYCGECGEYEDKWVILINKDMCSDAQVDTLIHEWCHAVRGEEECPEWRNHDDGFWIMFGSMWRSWTREE